jgi:stage II sporulation protein AB (anti-sigma F factor)
MTSINHMRLTFKAIAENEAFARLAISSFVMLLDPTVDEMEDIKTAGSEAITNAIVHGYGEAGGEVVLAAEIYPGREIRVLIEDAGKGIEDLEMARTPMYTSRPDLERSGMGFTIMESFMDDIEVESVPGHGTKVSLMKRLSEPA